ncbi:DUF6988 family protein [Rhodoferax sp.]|uniref:DUF6988 family protein n=1 Tax=Rhodoferax sp. TaxID=50421 RepID=UPI00374D01CD
MNSYIQRGIHPLSRLVAGYLPQLVFHANCNSNGFRKLATQLRCRMTGVPKHQVKRRRPIDEFFDCFHPIN